MAEGTGEENSQGITPEEVKKEVNYRAAKESDFKFNKPYLVKDFKGEVVEFTPKEGSSLPVQAGKYAGLVARGQVVVVVKEK